MGEIVKHRNALKGNNCARVCHNAPFGTRMSDKLPCVCKKLLAEKYKRDEKLPHETFFDELGNYKYCQPSIASYFKGVPSIGKLHGSRTNFIKDIVEKQGKVYRDVTAITILRYELIPYIQGKLPGVNANNSVLAVLERMYAENNNTLIRVKIPEIPGSKTARMKPISPEPKKRKTNKPRSQIQLSEPSSSSQDQVSQACSSSQDQISHEMTEMDQSCPSSDDPIIPIVTPEVPEYEDRVILCPSRLLDHFTEAELDKILEDVSITASIGFNYRGKYYSVSLEDVVHDPISGDGFFKVDPESELRAVNELKRDKAEMNTIAAIPGSLTKRLR